MEKVHTLAGNSGLHGVVPVADGLSKASEGLKGARALKVLARVGVVPGQLALSRCSVGLSVLFPVSLPGRQRQQVLGKSVSIRAYCEPLPIEPKKK